MKTTPDMTRLRRTTAHFWALCALAACTLGAALPARAQTALADQPLFSNANVPGNLALALSVEFPTAISVAYTNRTYSSANTYLGYFDPNKCYTYSYTDGTSVNNYFVPAVAATNRTCSGKWSGNFLNWASMQTIDPFRWVLTGGYRVIDESARTVVEKAWASTQGSAGSNFPDTTVTGGALIAGATPFPSSTNSLSISVWGLGNQMRFAVPDSDGSTPALSNVPTSYNGTTNSSGTVLQAFIRAQVCVASQLETNCVKYGANYKPEGLIQQYANKIRFSAFGYLNDGDLYRDGGVLRAQQKFVGPMMPVPGSMPVANAKGVPLGQTGTPQTTAAEWSATTGVMTLNPDADDAANTAGIMGLTSPITNSGVMNYLNKFGQSAQSYKTYDNVSELYYAALRYFKNLEKVPEWTAVPAGTSQPTIATWTDGFPVITAPPDPILYSCQRNFVLGIGDVHTWNDKNVPHASASLATGEPNPMPSKVSGDTSVDAVLRTNQVGVMEGLGASAGTTSPWGGCCGNNSALIAGLAYDAHIQDIRGRPVSKALPVPQTIDTYWVDVQEGQRYEINNQFYLATKYGGFTVPKGYVAGTAPLLASWHTNTDVNGTQPRPDNYFSGGQPAAMQAGLIAAFADIASKVTQFTTSFSTSLPQVAKTNNASFSSKYDSSTWTGEVTAGILAFDPVTGNPVTPLPTAWTLSSNLTSQFAGTGWNLNRRVVSWDGSTGVAFRSSGASQLDAAALTALDTSYVAGIDSVNFLNYLRGDQTNEVGVAGGTNAYRARATLLGDIVGSKAAPVGPPSFPFLDASNPGYSAFKIKWAARRTMVYVGANDGMMHAINGALLTTAPAIATTPPLEVDPNAGTEMFAYVPRALYQGPNGTPNTDGLASLGNPSFSHHYMVNATPSVSDIDFKNTQGSTDVAPNWRSVLIGGLGKGGKSYYALDVTDPVDMTDPLNPKPYAESVIQGKVMWEFTNPSLGYTFGAPLVMKTAKYGWVAVFTSGYNNSDGQGYFIFVNPRTGAFLEKVPTGAGTLANDAGLAHANAFVVDATNGTVDAIYAGDLLGNLWRLDVTGTGSYTAAGKLVKLATLTDASSNPQPVTTVPSIEVDPTNKKRVVMIGTGRLLDPIDISSTQGQSFYAFFDGTNAAFTAAPVLPLAFPYTRSKLSDNTGTSLTGQVVPATNAGWLEDLGVDVSSVYSKGPPEELAHTGTGVAYRVIGDSTTLAGSIAFASILPNGDPCNPSGLSRVYGRQYSSGLTTVKDPDTLISTSYVRLNGTVTDLRYLSVNGRPTLVSGTDSGAVGQINITPLNASKLRRLNWRELQTVD